MREAAIPGYRLSKARASTRLLITLAMLGLLSGLLSATALTITRTGLTPKSVVAYYRGTDAASSSNSNSPEDSLLVTDGPRPIGELVEVTHLHLMGGSLMLFLLCHLLSLCDVSEKLRSTLYAVSFVCFLTTFGSPWLIIYASPAFASLYCGAVVLFILSLLFLCLIPIYEMWWVGRKKNNS